MKNAQKNECPVNLVKQLQALECYGYTAKRTDPVLSFFSGAGGMDYGFVRAGFNAILAYDRERSAVDTYNANFPAAVARAEDLSRLTNRTILKLVDACGEAPRGVIGGPPCQGFSIGNTKASVDDPRFLAVRYSDLVSELNRVYDLDFFVFENVTGLKSCKHSERLTQIKERLDGAGFDVHEHQLDAQFFGVPQRRRRLFLVGINRSRHPGIKFIFPEGYGAIRTVRSAIDGLPDPVFRKGGMGEHDVPYHPNHWTMPPKSKHFEDQSFNGGRSFRRLDWERPS